MGEVAAILPTLIGIKPAIIYGVVETDRVDRNIVTTVNLSDEDFYERELTTAKLDTDVDRASSRVRLVKAAGKSSVRVGKVQVSSLRKIKHPQDDIVAIRVVTGNGTV